MKSGRGGKRAGAGRPVTIKPSEKRVQVAAMLRPAILKELDQYAKEEDLTRSKIIERAVKHYLEA